jgi:hypothetical protein
MVDLKASLIVLVASWLILSAGCAGDGGGETKTDNPEVIATSPQDGAVDVNLNPLVQVWFDQELDESTIDSAAIYVAGAVTERIEYEASEKAIRLYLRELLDPETEYDIIVDSTITGATGDPLLKDRAFAFTTGPMDCDHLEDYLEPNDTIGEAADIDIVKAYSLLSSCGAGYNDFYRFVLSDTVRVTARIDYVYSTEPHPMLYVRFKRSTGEAYMSYIGWIDAGNSLNLRYTFLPGTYYFELGGGSGVEHTVVYDLIMQISAPCEDDSLEDNDFIDEATPVQPGLIEGLRGCFQDRDYYSIGLGAGDVLTATVEELPHKGSQCYLAILGPDGSVLTGDYYTDYPAVETWTADADTTYYIAATWSVDDIDYRIEAEVLTIQGRP